MNGRSCVVAGLAAAFIMSGAVRSGVSSQGGAVLTGVASSQAEGKMEGVVVTARRVGATFDVSVVTDAQGRFSFPGSHVVPGDYAITIRAVGYELAKPVTATVSTGKPATADLPLQKAADVSKQLTSVEWMMNLPGSDADKDKAMIQAASCVYCHNIERIVRSSYTAEQWPAVITRMQKYYLDGTSYGYEGRTRSVLDSPAALERAEKNPSWGFWPALTKVDLGRYLATINQNGAGRNLPAAFKTLPRPKGVETKVIVTQYDMPRKGVVHDGDMDKDGNFWYSDQSAMFLGRFEPKTATFKEWQAPATKKQPAGTSDVVIDPEGFVWLPITNDFTNSTFGQVTRFDPKTETFEPTKKMPANANTQFMGLDGNGKVWAGFGPLFRIDRKTNTLEGTVNFRNAPNRPQDATGGGYQVEVDSKGNPVLTDFMGGYISKMDAATKQFKFIKVPGKDGMPRRGRMDKQDRFWFSLYRGNAIGMLDMKTDQVREYRMPFKYYSPYTVSAPDSRGRVFSPSNSSDRLARIDTKTGEVIVYLMPTRDFDTKKLAIDPKDGKTVWFANKRASRVVKVEQLD